MSIQPQPRPSPHKASAPVTPLDHFILGFLAGFVAAVPLMGPPILAVIHNGSQANWEALGFFTAIVLFICILIGGIQYFAVIRDPLAIRFILLGGLFLEQLVRDNKVLDPDLTTSLAVLLNNLQQALGVNPSGAPPSPAVGVSPPPDKPVQA